MECLFCKIAGGDIPAKLVYQDDDLVAFDDINPQAPVHKIIIPRKHIATMNEVTTQDNALMAKIMQAGVSLAKECGLADDGYRLVMNCNAHGGQSVFHIHLHLLGGRRMAWPPG